MLNNEKLFFAKALSQKIRNYILYIIAILIIIYCAYNFQENPVVISIIIVFFLFVSLITGNSQVAVFTDRIEFIIDHPIDRLSFRKIFQFKDIQSIDADLRLTKKGFVLVEIMSTWLPGFSVWNTLHIELKDGSKKIIKTSVYKNEIIKALQIVKQLTKNQIIITGI